MVVHGQFFKQVNDYEKNQASFLNSCKGERNNKGLKCVVKCKKKKEIHNGLTSESKESKYFKSLNFFCAKKENDNKRKFLSSKMLQHKYAQGWNIESKHVYHEWILLIKWSFVCDKNWWMSNKVIASWFMFFVMRNDIKMEFMLSWVYCCTANILSTIDVFFKKMALYVRLMMCAKKEG